VIAVGFALVNSALAITVYLFPSVLPPTPPSSTNPTAFGIQDAFVLLAHNSTALTSSGWLVVAGLWMWKGRVRSKWTSLGFDSDVFRLFVRMRGAGNRFRLLKALENPKDRFQVAKELGLQWKAVDRQIQILLRNGLISERTAYGKVKMFELTSLGRLLLGLLIEMNEEETQGNHGTEPDVGPVSSANHSKLDAN
jgi:predicted transcriptional regulator